MKRGKVVNFNALVSLFELILSRKPALSICYPDKLKSITRGYFL